MHCAQHASDELVNSVTLLDKRDKCRDATLVVSHIAEVREDQLLELFNLVLQNHKVADGLVTFVRVVDGLQAEILLVFEGSVELGVLVVERELRQEVVNVFADQGRITAHSLTSSTHAAVQAIDPGAVCHCLLQGAGVTFLEDLVDCNEGLERLDFVGEDGLTVDTVNQRELS